MIYELRWSFYVSIILLIFYAFGLWSCEKAQAHSWYDPQCCSNTDCRSVSDEDVLEGDKDYIYLPLGLHFPKSMEKPSHDSKYHVCYGSGTLNGKIEYHPLCIYTRQGY